MEDYKRGLSDDVFELALKDCTNKVEGLNSDDWQDIVERYDLGIHRDVLRKAFHAPLGGYAIYKYLKEKELDKLPKGKKLVSARELHEFLESKQDFSTWIKGRINKYKFIENEGYITAPQIYGTANGCHSTRNEYIITVGMAKELSMVENNEKGQETRRYFIACEKKVKETSKVQFDYFKLSFGAKI